jgi:hypothetical protein
MPAAVICRPYHYKIIFHNRIELEEHAIFSMEFRRLRLSLNILNNELLYESF